MGPKLYHFVIKGSLVEKLCNIRTASQSKQSRVRHRRVRLVSRDVVMLECLYSWHVQYLVTLSRNVTFCGWCGI